ncbi:NADP malic enzyme [Chlorella sorokiniana]|uniref:Malic enzyme n=1 Tax=Chlorella sorokiniana TaxID=3076 RepID=A0A2P6TU02_CHLSO|nr:NADP malic enzyme [Chlorella sorokiniana]|eukprot:PRW57539.1 NADP malic enzyme [Chlorella sorokiniana]
MTVCVVASPTAAEVGLKVPAGGAPPMGSPTVPKDDAVMAAVRGAPTDLDRFLYLRRLQRDNPSLFYRVLMEHTEECLPFLYTPTVGEACQKYHRIGVPTYGLYLHASERGRFLDLLRAYPQQDIRVVVVTDGERILGLGDLGAGGMGISEGKSLLYTAAAGVPPHQILPVVLDVGTNNQALLDDPQYAGLRQRRVTGAEYDSLVEEFIRALKAWRPHVLLQFEDFANHTAFHLLERYRPQLACFNDDIQGTACICLAGVLAALRAAGKGIEQQRILFYGAGEAGTGIGELIAICLEHHHGMSREEGRRHCYFMDSKGLVCASRTDLQHHKRPFAHNVPPCRTLEEAIQALRPTVLIGVSTMAGAFSRSVLQAMAALNERPVIMPLSNPTSKSECTFQEAVEATGGRVLFASGSPFPPLQHGGRMLYPAQANNAYVFPAIGHAAVLTQCKQISDDVFLVAAETLAEMSSLPEIEQGFLFPRFAGIKTVSVKLMAAVADFMVRSQLGTVPADFDAVCRQAGVASSASNRARWEAYAAAHMFHPSTSHL